MNSRAPCSLSSYIVLSQPCGGIRTRVKVNRCMSWFKRDSGEDDKRPKPENGERRVRTEGLWQKCEGCRQIIWKKDLEATSNVCPKCSFHFRIDAAARLRLLFDGGEYESFDNELKSSDPLGFVDSKPYTDRKSTRLNSSHGYIPYAVFC